MVNISVNEVKEKAEASISLSNHSLASASKRRRTLAMVISAVIVVTLFSVLAPVVPANVPGGGIVGGHIQAYASISFVLTASFGMFNNMTFNAPLTAPTHNDTNNTYLNQFTFTSYFAVVGEN